MLQFFTPIVCAAIMLKLFAKYVSVGIVNTAIHWLIFVLCIYALHLSQALANLLAFSFAVSFSYVANARFTFRSQATLRRYILFVGFMGMLSVAVGWMADKTDLNPLFTLVIFSAISLMCGFFYSKHFVFRDPQ